MRAFSCSMCCFALAYVLAAVGPRSTNPADSRASPKLMRVQRMPTFSLSRVGLPHNATCPRTTSPCRVSNLSSTCATSSSRTRSGAASARLASPFCMLAGALFLSKWRMRSSATCLSCADRLALRPKLGFILQGQQIWLPAIPKRPVRQLWWLESDCGRWQPPSGIQHPED